MNKGLAVLGTDGKLASNVFKKALLEKDISDKVLDLQRREETLFQLLFLIVDNSRLLLPDSVFYAATFEVTYLHTHVL